MEAFKDFVASDAFFPVLTGLMLTLVLVFVWVLLSGRKKIDKRKYTNVISNDVEGTQLSSNTNNIVTNDAADNTNDFNTGSKTNASVLPILPTQNTISSDNSATNNDIVVPNNEVSTMSASIETDAVNTLEQDKVLENENVAEVQDDIIIDLPIQKMDSSPVEISFPQNSIDDIGETVEIGLTQPLNEENVSSEEIVNIELPAMKVEEIGETVELPEIKSSLSDEVGESVEIPIESTKRIEVGDNTLAFKSLPEEIRTINENVVVEEKKEYTTEKTELFELPDFNNLETNTSGKIAAEVEKDAMKTANDYVSSVF